MAKVSDALRQRLTQQKRSMGSQLIIDNKTFEKGLFRVLPCGDDTPGKACHSVYCERIKKGSTLPSTFGLKCPITDYFANLKTADKDTRDAAYNTARMTTEYWMAVLDREAEENVDAPAVRVLRAKKTVNEAIIGRMIDEDDGDDVTDLIEGRDCRIKKTGVLKDTKWAVTWLDAKPISDNEDFIAAVQAIADNLDVVSKFYRVDWDNLEEVYRELTGEDMEPHYREQEGAVPADADDDAPPAKVAPKVAPKVAAKTAPKVLPKKAAPAPVVDEGPDENGITVGTTRVTFDYEGAAVIALVQSVNADGAYEALDEAGESWVLNLEDFSIVDEEEVAEQATDEPEELGPENTDEPAAPVRKGPAKAAPAKPAPAPAKAAPAKAAPAKPAVAAKVPLKPALKPAASEGIKARLRK